MGLSRKENLKIERIIHVKTRELKDSYGVHII